MAQFTEKTADGEDRCPLVAFSTPLEGFQCTPSGDAEGGSLEASTTLIANLRSTIRMQDTAAKDDKRRIEWFEGELERLYGVLGGPRAT